MFRERCNLRKKALAPVLSVALLTLGAIIAVSLLWVFASKTMKTDKQIVDPDCLTTNLEIVNCQTYGFCAYPSGNGVYNADVLIKRGSGGGNLTGIRFSFEDWLSRKFVYDFNLTDLVPGYSLEELQSLRFNQYPAKVPTKGPRSDLRVIPLLGEEYGVCPVSSKPFTCLNVQEIPSIGSLPDTGYCCQCPRNESECYNGNNPDYPIENGIVYHDEGNGFVPYQFGFPPGYLSVCCESVPQIYANQNIKGIQFGPVGSSCPLLE